MKRYLLYATLLLWCTNRCLASIVDRCTFDDMMKQHNGMKGIQVVHESPLAGEEAGQAYTVVSDNWEPIRIRTFTEDLGDPTRYCIEWGERCVKCPGWMKIEINRCTAYDVLTAEMKAALINEVIPMAIKLHADRLLVQRAKTPLIVPPFPEGSLCSNFSVPASHRSEGVPDADMVIYVAAFPREPFSFPCAMNEKRRPVVGVMSFPPHAIPDKLLAVRVAAHEMAHLLGFGYEQMMALKMVSSKTVVRDKKSVVVAEVISPKTVEQARKHYGCEELTGVPLEDMPNMASHWERQNAKDELMGTRVDMGYGLYYTALTMAAFEDMLFYKVRWGMEEPMSWGKDSGCGLLKARCEAPNCPNMFCDRNEFTRCTSDRHSVGACVRDYVDIAIEAYNIVEPFSKGYNDRYLRFMDCAKESEFKLNGSLTHEDSWCLDAESLTVKDVGKKDIEVAGVCAKVRCTDDAVEVQYRGSNEWHKCPEGNKITPNSDSFTGGSIKCPRYTEVCTIAANGSSLVVPKIVSPAGSTTGSQAVSPTGSTTASQAVSPAGSTTASQAVSPTGSSGLSPSPTENGLPVGAPKPSSTVVGVTEGNKGNTENGASIGSTNPTAPSSPTQDSPIDDVSNVYDNMIPTGQGGDGTVAAVRFGPLVLLAVAAAAAEMPL